MPKLEAFLLTWLDDLIPITKVFPQGYPNKKNLAELLVITKSLLNCGKGTLQHKNKLFYYRTYIPDDNLSKKNSYSDINTSNSNTNIKKVFILFLCDNNYKKKDIDTLTKSIYEILEEDAFDKQDLKKDHSRKINLIYDLYQNIETNSEQYIQLSDINNNTKNIFTESNKSEKLIIDNNNDNIINTNNRVLSSDIEKNNLDESRKESSSRIIWSKVNKSKSNLGSIDINDLTTIKESDSDLSIIFKQSLDENLNFSQMKKMKAIKKINIVLCSILFVISLVLIILLFIYQ